jgi:hypothetical protein
MDLAKQVNSRKERMAALASLKRKAVESDGDESENGQVASAEVVKFRNYTPSDAPETDAAEKTTDLISKVKSPILFNI